MGSESGRIIENSLKFGDTITAGKGLQDDRGAPLRLDIEAEIELVEKTKLILQASSASHTASKSSVKDDGVKRLKELGLERLVTLIRILL